MTTEDPKPGDPYGDRPVEQGYSLLAVTAATSAAAAAPFVTAMLSELGTRSAGAIDGRVREAARRFLRRQAQTDRGVSPIIPLRTQYDWELIIDVEAVPFEGLLQLAALAQSDAPTRPDGEWVGPGGTIHWTGQRWIASAALTVAVFAWDDARAEWEYLPRPSRPSAGEPRQ